MPFSSRSLYDLHYCILRQGLTPCVLDNTKFIILRPPKLQHSPWAEYIPVKTDPRVLYTVSNGTRSSPIPRVSYLTIVYYHFTHVFISIDSYTRKLEF